MMKGRGWLQQGDGEEKYPAKMILGFFINPAMMPAYGLPCWPMLVHRGNKMLIRTFGPAENGKIDAMNPQGWLDFALEGD